MREGGKILAKTLQAVAKIVKPGVKTEELNDLATEMILQAGAMPAFLGYEGFPASICVSVNEEVVHGVPGPRKLEEGDIVGLDLGVLYPPENCRACSLAGGCGSEPGMFTDAALTIPVGKVSLEAERLIEAAKKALSLALAQVKPGARLGEIGFAIQQYVEKEGFAIVRELVGHGVGYELHEEPQILNYGQKNEGIILKKGMTLAIEPMLTNGDWQVKKSKSGGYVTKDGSLSSHFEHTVVVTEKGCEILTRI